MRALSATLRDWDRPALNGSDLPVLATLLDASKAIALGALLRSRTLTRLTLSNCRLGESSATAIGGLLAASLPIKYLDVRANEMGERGLTAIAAAVQAGSVLAELHVEHALPRPHTYASVDALAAAAQRCAAFRSIYLGDTLVSASGGDGPLARLQHNLLSNVEQHAMQTHTKLLWGRHISTSFAPPPSPPPSPPADGGDDSEEGPDSALSKAIGILRESEIRSLRLSHEASAACVPLPRQLDLLRAILDCRSLRVAQLVNVGLGDAWGLALATALPGMRHLRALDVTHNYIGSAAVMAIAQALQANNSLLWMQLLPQWISITRDAARSLTAALSPRRIKADLAVRAAKGVLSSRGDVGEPSVAFEWHDSMVSTGFAQPPLATINPRWEEHFTLNIPAADLWPPTRAPLALTLLDLRRTAQLASDPPMGLCEVPLGALLLADPNLNVRCAVQRHRDSAPIAGRGGGAELHLELTIMHVGNAHADDSSVGAPAARKKAQQAEVRAEVGAAKKLQSMWRSLGVGTLDELGRRKNLRGAFADVISRATAARAAAARSTIGGRLSEHFEACLSSGPWKDGAQKVAPLLPFAMQRSDDLDEGSSRRRGLLRVALCMLAGSICLLLASALVLLVLVHQAQQDP